MSRTPIGELGEGVPSNDQELENTSLCAVPAPPFVRLLHLAQGLDPRSSGGPRDTAGLGNRDSGRTLRRLAPRGSAHAIGRSAVGLAFDRRSVLPLGCGRSGGQRCRACRSSTLWHPARKRRHRRLCNHRPGRRRAEELRGRRRGRSGREACGGLFRSCGIGSRRSPAVARHAGRFGGRRGVSGRPAGGLDRGRVQLQSTDQWRQRHGRCRETRPRLGSVQRIGFAAGRRDCRGKRSPHHVPHRYPAATSQSRARGPPDSYGRAGCADASHPTEFTGESNEI